MILVVAEKPSVARDLARVLNCSRKEGYFESLTHRVAWALGHLVGLKDPDELDERYVKWRKEDLPILPEAIPTKVLPKTKSQFSLLKKLMLDPQTTQLVCATDAGREGELIFRLIYAQTGCKKPVSRLWISSLTDAAIKEGFEQLKPAASYDGLYRSALSRAQADWLVGMNASRAFTLQYKALLSVGRVQTPTLAILVERELEIKNFVPQPYCTLEANFGDYQGLWFDPGTGDERTNHRIPDKAKAQAIQLAVKGQPAQVIKADTQQKRELPPQLFDLTSLQREANRVLGFTAEKTLKTAQALYETRKALTYPRTDSRYLPRDMVSRVYKAMEALSNDYPDLVNGIPRKESKLPFSPRVYDDSKVSDHHAIIPTPQKADLEKFSADECALFDLVIRRFIGVFYPAFEYDQTTVVTQCLNHVFKSSGRVTRQEGWKAVLKGSGKPSKAAKEEGEASLPPLQVGDERVLKSSKIKEEVTKAPAPHTDASLLARMERPGMKVEDDELQETLKKAGLGTPATRAATIERLIQVGYAARRGKVIYATEKGINLIAVVPQDIASPVLTGKWEQALEDIAKGTREAKGFMESIHKLTAHLVNQAFSEVKPVEFPREVRTSKGRVRTVSTAKALEGLACPLCGKAIQETDRAFGCADWKGGCAFTLWKNAFLRVKGPMLNEAIVRLLLTQGQARGSSGTLAIHQSALSFTLNNQTSPALTVPLAYKKASKAESGKAPKPTGKKPRTAKPKA